MKNYFFFISFVGRAFGPSSSRLVGFHALSSGVSGTVVRLLLQHLRRGLCRHYGDWKFIQKQTYNQHTGALLTWYFTYALFLTFAPSYCRKVTREEIHRSYKASKHRLSHRKNNIKIRKQGLIKQCYIRERVFVLAFHNTSLGLRPWIANSKSSEIWCCVVVGVVPRTFWRKAVPSKLM